MSLRVRTILTVVLLGLDAWIRHCISSGKSSSFDMYNIAHRELIANATMR